MRRKRLPRDPYRRVVGRPVSVLLEPAASPEKIDHVWVNLALDKPGPMRAVINTVSLRNQAAGFDDRVWLATVSSAFDVPPAPGIFAAEGLDYDEISEKHRLEFVAMNRAALELLFCEKLRLADLIEVWGELYERAGPGVHQIHSRRSSCAVAEDQRGRDGAFQCYDLKTRTAELFLLKFCGQ